MKSEKITNYHEQATYFAELPEYNDDCGTDFLVVKEAPRLLSNLHPLKKILDLGCGTGLATRFLKRHFPNATVLGADINSTMLVQASEADPEGIYLCFPLADQTIQYPFLDNTFDAIVCSFVVHENQTREDLKQFLHHAIKMLRPGGTLIAWDVYKNLSAGKWLTIETISPTQKELQDGEDYHVRLFPANAEVKGHYWSPELIAKMLKEMGVNQCQIDLPLAKEDSSLPWKDELKSAPFFILQAYKDRD